MMFYRKKTKYPNKTSGRLEINDFLGINTKKNEGLINKRHSVKLVNFDYKNGCLTDSLGLRQVLDFDKKILSAYHYKYYDQIANKRDDRLILYVEGGEFYQYNFIGTPTIIEGLTFEQQPKAVNYRLNGVDTIIFTSKGDCLTCYNPEVGVVVAENAPKITSMAVHYERLFVTIDGEKNAIWFSDDLDVSNWNVSLYEAGFIEMYDDFGSLLRAVKFIDSIYIFKSYGIARLTAYAEQTEFALSNLYTCTARLIEDSVSVCGDRIIFMAENGFFAFDGVSATKILSNLDGFIDYKFGKSYYSSGKYYCQVESKQGEHLILCYDINNGYHNLVFLGEIECLCPFNSESVQRLFAVDGVGKLLLMCDTGKKDNLILRKYYKSGILDFGRKDKLKTLKGLYIKTKQDITLRIISDKGIIKINAEGSDNILFYRFSLVGREFEVEITAQLEGNQISDMTIIYEV